MIRYNSFEFGELEWIIHREECENAAAGVENVLARVENTRYRSRKHLYYAKKTLQLRSVLVNEGKQYFVATDFPLFSSGRDLRA